MKNKVAIIIKTCQGRASLLWVLSSIKHALKEVDYRIYISDEKPLDDWKKDIYEKLNTEGHHIELLDKGISCGVARNKLLDQLNDENLVLRIDDDFELGGEFNFLALKTVLQYSDEIGFCSDLELQIGNNKSVYSGSIRPSGGYFKIRRQNLIKKFHSPLKIFSEVSSIRFSFAEHTRNLLLIKRDVVEKVRWSEELLFEGEHEEFMLSIKDAGYIGAYTPDSIHYHRDDLKHLDSMSNSKRPGIKEFKKVLKENWGCEKIVVKYPLTWYLIEGVRSVVSKSILRT